MTPLNDSGPAIAALVGLLVYLLILVGVYLWYAFALSKLFPKLGAEGWKGWVPVLNDMEVLTRGGVPGWSIVFAFLPVVSFYYLYLRIVAVHRIGTRFGKGAGMTVLGVLLPPLWATLLAGAQPVAGAPLEQRVAGFVPTPTAPVAPAVAVAPSIPQPPAPPVVGAPAVPPVVAAPPAPPAPPTPPAPGPVAPVVAAPPMPPVIVAPPTPPAPPAPPAPPVVTVPPALVEPPAPPAPPSIPVLPPAPVLTPEPVVEVAAPVVAPAPASAPEPEPEAVAPSAVVPPPVVAPAPLVRPAPAPAAFMPKVREVPPAPAPAPVPPAPAPAADDDEDFGETIVVERAPRIRYRLQVEGGVAIPLTAGTVVLGRKPAAGEPGTQDVAVPDTTRTLSKVHARLQLGDAGWTITDLDSTNGVVVVAPDDEETLLESGASAPVPGRFILGKVAMRIVEEGATT